MKNSGPIDFVILAPLPEEIDALCEFFKVEKSERMLLPDDIEFYDTTVLDKGFRVRIVRLPKQGVMRTAVAATRLILTWRPKCIVSFGIAGKVDKDVKIGDVLVAEEVFYYEPAKEASPDPESQDTQSSRQAAPHHFFTSSDFKQAFSEASASLNKAWFKVFDAIVASGEKKIAGGDTPSRSAILDHDRRTHILEMEAAGVGGAVAGVGPEVKPLWLVVKGVSDSAGSDESDTSQKNADPSKKRRRKRHRSTAAKHAAEVLRSIIVGWSPSSTNILHEDVSAVRKLAKGLARVFPKSLVEPIEELTWARALRDKTTLPAVHYHWIIKHAHIHWLDFCYLLMLERAQNIGVPVHLLINDKNIDQQWTSRTEQIIKAVFKGYAQVSLYTAVMAKHSTYSAYASSRGFDQFAKDTLKENFKTPEDQVKGEGYDAWLAYISWCAANTRRCVILAWVANAGRYERIKQDISLDPLIVTRPTLTLNGTQGKSDEPGSQLVIDPPRYDSLLSWLNSIPDAKYVEDLAKYLTLEQTTYNDTLNSLDEGARALLLPWDDLHKVLSSSSPDDIFCNTTCRLLSAMAEWNREFFQNGEVTKLARIDIKLSMRLDPTPADFMRVQKWQRNFDPDPIYCELLQTVADHCPESDYSVIAHGSAAWGGRTVLNNGLPVSDVDILVIGINPGVLSVAARALHAISKPFIILGSPLFKLSAKFRTVEEIRSSRISANELAALRVGKLLCGRSEFEVYRPNREWFHFQACLSLRTRIAYVTKQRERIRNDPFEQTLCRYLAARVLLDVPTLALVTKGILGNGYAERVMRFLEMFKLYPKIDSESDERLAVLLNQALHTKYDPENYQCGTIEEATVRLLDYATRLGIGPVAPIDTTDEFWKKERPLDLRDQNIWRGAVGGQK